MARYTGPNNKQARRVGFSILENGKDLKRPYGPGQHGKDRKRKPSNYAIQLNEKQKVKYHNYNYYFHCCCCLHTGIVFVCKWKYDICNEGKQYG